MASYVRKTAATLFAASALAVGVAGPASAQVEQDGLVNANVGDITIQDVNVTAVVGVVATLCDVVDVTNVNVLAVVVDQTGRAAPTVCVTDDRDRVTITNN